MNADLKWQTIFWSRVERYSPILCRLLARDDHGNALTVEEISRVSGLSTMEIYYLSVSLGWQGVDIFTMKAFTRGCRMDLTDRDQMKRADIYLRGSMVNGQRCAPKFTHLKKDPERWTKEFRDLLMRYQAHLEFLMSLGRSR